MKKFGKTASLWAVDILVHRHPPAPPNIPIKPIDNFLFKYILKKGR